MTREERFEIEINASPKEVWERLTTAEGLASWFGTRAEIDPRIDGERVVGWGDGVEMSGRITDIEPPQRLLVAYTSEREGTGAEEWVITTDGEGRGSRRRAYRGQILGSLKPDFSMT